MRQPIVMVLSKKAAKKWMQNENWDSLHFKMDFWPGRSMTAFFCTDLHAKLIPSLTSELWRFHKERNFSVRVTHVYAFQALQDWSCSHLNLEEKTYKRSDKEMRLGEYCSLTRQRLMCYPTVHRKGWSPERKNRCPWRIGWPETCGSCLLSGHWRPWEPTFCVALNQRPSPQTLTG